MRLESYHIQYVQPVNLVSLCRREVYVTQTHCSEPETHLLQAEELPDSPKPAGDEADHQWNDEEDDQQRKDDAVSAGWDGQVAARTYGHHHAAATHNQVSTGQSLSVVSCQVDLGMLLLEGVQYGTVYSMEGVQCTVWYSVQYGRCTVYSMVLHPDFLRCTKMHVLQYGTCRSCTAYCRR